jgi:putative intracellular protease/amidase
VAQAKANNSLKIDDPDFTRYDVVWIAGGIYSKQERFMDFFATSTVVDDEKRFVTGQKQNSSHETAQKIMAILDQRVK